MAPAWRVGGEATTTLHLVEVAATPSGAWLDLTDLERLPYPVEVRTAIRTGIAEHRGTSPRPVERPDWFAPTWLAVVDPWIDERLAEDSSARSGPSAVIKLWSLSAVVEVPTEAGAVFFKAACARFRAEAASPHCWVDTSVRSFPS